MCLGFLVSSFTYVSKFTNVGRCSKPLDQNMMELTLRQKAAIEQRTLFSFLCLFMTSLLAGKAETVRYLALP
jgi:hypothetical protein